MPPHQKHCDNCCIGFIFFRGFTNVDLLVKFTCSYCVVRAVFISLFANTVASNVLATSTTSRSVTFVCAVFLCLCPFPINFTRRVSDVKSAINWSLVREVFIFTLGCLITYSRLPGGNRFVFILQQVKKFLSFP